MKALFATFAVFSVLCLFAGGYFLWEPHNEIQALQVKVQTLQRQQDTLSASVKKDQYVQNRILKNEKILNENQVESDKAINEIIKAISQPVPETDTRSRL